MVRRREYEDGGWTKVVRRNRQQQHHRKESNEEELRRLVTTFYVANLPEGWNSSRLWREFAGIGRLVDAFIPRKKDASGNSFGFVRLLKVSDLNGVLKSMNELVCDGKRIRVNVARHERAKRGGRGEDGGNDESALSGKSFLNALRGGKVKESGTSNNVTVSKSEMERKESLENKKVEVVIPSSIKLREHRWLDSCLVGVLKNIELLSKCMSMIQAYGLGECDLRYLGGLTVLLKFNSYAIADCFKG